MIRDAGPAPVTYEETGVRDRVAVVGLLATSVPDSCRGLVPYHAPGYGRYVTTVLGPPAPYRTVILRVIQEAGRIVAVADWRVLADLLFLNGLSVDRRCRGRGHGRRLLEDGVRMAADLGLPSLALDVETGNAPALALYRSAGFEPAGVSAWVDVQPPPAPAVRAGTRSGPSPGPWGIPPATADPCDATAGLRIVNWTHFIAHRRTFGFADLNVRLDDGYVSTARQIGGVLRIGADPRSRALASPLRALTGAQRVYAIIDGDDHPDAFARFHRMRRAAHLPAAGAAAAKADPGLLADRGPFADQGPFAEPGLLADPGPAQAAPDRLTATATDPG